MDYKENKDIIEFKLCRWLKILTEDLAHTEVVAREYDLNPDQMDVLLAMKHNAEKILRSVSRI